MMLDANVWGRCRRLAREVAKLAGVPNVGAINIGFENRDPGATRFTLHTSPALLLQVK